MRLKVRQVGKKNSAYWLSGKQAECFKDPKRLLVNSYKITGKIFVFRHGTDLQPTGTSRPCSIAEGADPSSQASMS
jgi:hypothetical protein